MATESQVIEAVLATVNADRSETNKVTEPSKVPTKRPANHTTVTIVERPGGSGRSGRRSTRGWQVYFLAASAYSEDSARDSLEDIHEALHNRVLTVGDERTSPIASGPGRPVASDDGRFSGSTSYLFTT